MSWEAACWGWLLQLDDFFPLFQLEYHSSAVAPRPWRTGWVTCLPGKLPVGSGWNHTGLLLVVSPSRAEVWSHCPESLDRYPQSCLGLRCLYHHQRKVYPAEVPGAAGLTWPSSMRKLPGSTCREKSGLAGAQS